MLYGLISHFPMALGNGRPTVSEGQVASYSNASFWKESRSIVRDYALTIEGVPSCSSVAVALLEIHPLVTHDVWAWPNGNVVMVTAQA